METDNRIQLENELDSLTEATVENWMERCFEYCDPRYDTDWLNGMLELAQMQFPDNYEVRSACSRAAVLDAQRLANEGDNKEAIRKLEQLLELDPYCTEGFELLEQLSKVAPSQEPTPAPVAPIVVTPPVQSAPAPAAPEPSLSLLDEDDSFLDAALPELTESDDFLNMFEDDELFAHIEVEDDLVPAKGASAEPIQVEAPVPTPVAAESAEELGVPAWLMDDIAAPAQASNPAPVDISSQEPSIFEEEPVVVDTSLEEPSVEEPSVEEPSIEVPSAEVPSIEEPSIEVPSAEQPSIEVPSIEQPSAEVPSVEVPSAEQPSIEVPSAEVPSIEQPSAEEPSVEVPSAEQPSVEVPSIEQPSAEEPSIEVPSIEVPSAEQPSVTHPSAEPAVSQPQAVASIEPAFIAPVVAAVAAVQPQSWTPSPQIVTSSAVSSPTPKANVGGWDEFFLHPRRQPPISNSPQYVAAVISLVQQMLAQSRPDSALRLLVDHREELSERSEWADWVSQAVTTCCRNLEGEGKGSSALLTAAWGAKQLPQAAELIALQSRLQASYSMPSLPTLGFGAGQSSRITHWLEQLRANPSNGKLLADVHAELGDNLEQFLQLFRSLAVEMPDNADQVLNLGWAYLQVGPPALALVHIQRALRIQMSQRGQQLLIEVYAKLGQEPLKESAIQRLHELYP